MRRSVALLLLVLVLVSTVSTRAEIAGVTVRESGAIVSGASIQLVGLDPLKGISPLGTGTSNGQGEFRIKLPESEPSAGRLMYLIASEGERIWIEPVLNPRAVRRVELRPGLKVSGTVLDSEGKPIEAAKVKAVRLGRDRFFGRQNLGTEIVGFVAGDSTLTDSAGRFTYGTLPAGWALELEISKPGFSPLATKPIPVDSAAQITLRPADSTVGRISGKVIERSTGNPVPNLHVTAGSGSGKAFHASTAADGAFSFGDLLPGEYAVWVMHSEKPVEPEVGIEVNAGSLAEVTLFAVEGTLVKGRVLNQDGAGVQGITIIVPGSLPAVTDSDGGFSVRALPGPGVVTTSGLEKGFIPTMREVQVPETGEVAGLELKLSPAPTISGRVLNSSGEGVNGALIRLMSSDGPIDLAETGSNGDFQFILETLPEGACHIIACDPATGDGVVERHDPGPDESVELKLLPAASVAGVLKSPDNEPISGAQVLPMLQIGRFRILSTQNKTSTDASGRFEIHGLIPEAEYSLRIETEDGTRHSEKLPALKAGEQVSAEFVIPH